MPERLSLPRGGDREAFRGAAYRLIELAYVRLDLSGKTLVAVLAPKSGKKSLKKDFWAAYDGERRRAAVRKAGAKAEAALLSKALALAAHADAKRDQPAESLPPEVEAEIAALLAEHEAAPKERLGIRRNWEDLRKEP